MRCGVDVYACTAHVLAMSSKSWKKCLLTVLHRRVVHAIHIKLVSTATPAGPVMISIYLSLYVFLSFSPSLSAQWLSFFHSVCLFLFLCCMRLVVARGRSLQEIPSEHFLSAPISQPMAQRDTPHPRHILTWEKERKKTLLSPSLSLSFHSPCFLPFCLTQLHLSPSSLLTVYAHCWTKKAEACPAHHRQFPPPLILSLHLSFYPFFLSASFFLYVCPMFSLHVIEAEKGRVLGLSQVKRTKSSPALSLFFSQSQMYS